MEALSVVYKKKLSKHFVNFTQKKTDKKKTRSVQARHILQCDTNNLLRWRLDKESGILLGWGIIRFQKKSIGSSESS